MAGLCVVHGVSTVLSPASDPNLTATPLSTAQMADTVLDPGYILTHHLHLISSAMDVLDLSPCSSKLNTSRWWLLQCCCSAAEHDDLLSVSPSSSSPDQCQQSARTPGHSMARMEKLQDRRHVLQLFVIAH